MFTLAVLMLQTVLILASAVAGAWITGGIGNRQPPGDPAAPAPPLTALEFLPDPEEATIGDIQRGADLRQAAFDTLTSGAAGAHGYEEARRLAAWVLQAGQAAESRLARQIDEQESDGDRLDAATAQRVVARGLEADVPHRTLAALTGWSKTWVGKQSQLLGGNRS